jgi:ATP-dependent DNA helicase RecQ
VFRQLVAAGLLEVDVEGHGALRLTAGSGSVLKGERTLQLRTEAPVARRRDRTATTRDRDGAALPADAAERFAALRQWRGETARAQSVPAYVIFHDSTLRDIALRRPQHLDELATVNGVGAAKLERYGSAVLDALAGTP